MACFLVPAAEAIVTTAITKLVKNKEASSDTRYVEAAKTHFSAKLGWLNNLLWGGSALLAFEHVWHGEVIPTFPFLTAVQTGETADMLAEMSSAGVGMAATVTAVWLVMVGVSTAIEKRSLALPEQETA